MNIIPANEQGLNAAGNQAVKDLAQRIATEAPELADLSAEQLDRIAQVVVAQQLTNKLAAEARTAGIDWTAERLTYLESLNSQHTRIAYHQSIQRLEQWADYSKLNILQLTPKQADDFTYSIKAEGRAPASVRRDIAACSALYTWLSRRHEGITNPFRGSKARPKKQAKKAAAIPSQREARAILQELTGETRAAAAVMMHRGLRVGALPSLTIRGERFTTRSKGKDVTGELPAKALQAIRTAGLDPRTPFQHLTADIIRDRIRYTTGKMHKAGKLAAAYSVHDFRHLYAVTEYHRDKDIYRLKQLLGHASIQVTEHYLQGIGELT